jgi:hypothetical protein
MTNSIDLVDNRRVFEATYRTVDSEQNAYWTDNPLIEALPPILTEGNFFGFVTDLPPFLPEVRKRNSQQRISQLDQCMRLTVPMTSHLFLKQRFDRVIRDGYGDRNPVKNPNFLGLQEKLELAKKLTGYALGKPPVPTSPGFSIIGIGGVGKTHGLDIVLSTYPQVIVHKDYADARGIIHQLQRVQIVYLKITCPPDGTLKALCDAFFQAVDSLLNTNYYEEYGTKTNKYRTASQMVPNMALVASLCSLGVLVIDEIQYLSKQKSGGVELMLHFFSYLMDLIQVPVILVGTPKADEILNGAFWQMRRNAGQGHFEWSRLKRDAKGDAKRNLKCEWERFMAAVWKYQYCTKPVPLEDDLVPEALSDVLYQESQGIIDFALKLFRLSQERAINLKTEELTSGLIAQVAKDLFGNMRVVVQAMVSGKAPKGLTIDDIKFRVDKNYVDLHHQQNKTAIPPNADQNHAPEEKMLKKSPRDSSLARPLLDCFDAATRENHEVIGSMRAGNFIKSAREFKG